MERKFLKQEPAFENNPFRISIIIWNFTKTLFRCKIIYCNGIVYIKKNKYASLYGVYWINFTNIGT